MGIGNDMEKIIGDHPIVKAHDTVARNKIPIFVAMGVAGVVGYFAHNEANKESADYRTRTQQSPPPQYLPQGVSEQQISGNASVKSQYK